ncbi:MAG: hypothetical protein DDT27_01431 [Dehalococcoidia bacterium]|nr:hypothetical protein [Chloroflexota bacterium]
MKLPIIFHIPGSLREIVDSGTSLRSTGSQTLLLRYELHQLDLDQVRRHTCHRLTVHLRQIGLGAQSPGFGKFPHLYATLACLSHCCLIQEPRDLRPAPQALLQLNSIWLGSAQEDKQLPGECLLPDRLGVEKGGHHGLFEFPSLECREFLLDIPGFLQLVLQDGRPVLSFAFVFFRCDDRRQFSRCLRKACPPRPIQQNVDRCQGRGVPLLCIPQSHGESAQYASGSLKPFQLRPFGVEDLG